MVVIYLAAPLMTIYGIVNGNAVLSLAGGGAWFLMAAVYMLTLRLYKLNLLWAIVSPISGLIYTAMTVDSARQHWAGHGGVWKGRSYLS
jgi:hypothetical protein